MIYWPAGPGAPLDDCLDYLAMLLLTELKPPGAIFLYAELPEEMV